MYAVKGVYNGKSVLVKEPVPVAEQCDVIITFLSSISSNREVADSNVRKKAFDFLMNFPKKSLPDNFDYKQELTNAMSEKYDSIN